MKIACISDNESERLSALLRYDILDTPPDPAFDKLVELAAHICRTPIAIISLIDENRQWFKAIKGLDVCETSRDLAFCAHAILQEEILVIPDATKDERFADNPLVTGPPEIRFYAGVPLITPDKYSLGTLCVIDRVSRSLAESDLIALRILADQVVAQLELRLSHRINKEYAIDLQRAQEFRELDRERLENKRRYKQMFEDTAAIAFLLEPTTGRIIDANNAASKFWGYSRDELQRMDISQIIDLQQGEIFFESARTQDNSTHPLEWVHKLKSGELRHVEVYSSPLVIQGNTLLYSILHDISNRKLAESNLIEQELRYHTLADSGQALIWTSGKDTLCDYFNKIWLEFTGRTMEQEIGNGWTDSVHPNDFMRCLEIYLTAFEKREIFGMDYRLRRHDGVYRWIRDEGCPRYNSKGEFIGYIGYCLDITDRKIAEDALAESEQKLRGLFELSPVGIALTDMNGTYIEFNESFRAICGYSAEELKSMDYWTLTPKEYLEQEVAQIQLLTSKGSYGPYIKEYLQKDGNRIPIQLSGTLIRGKDGKQYIWSIVEDITERKKQNWHLKHLGFALSHINEAIYLMGQDAKFIYVNDEACRALGYSKEEFLGGMGVPDISVGWTDVRFAETWQLLKNIGSSTIESIHRTKDGRLFPVEIYANYFEYDGRGYNMSMVRDITKRKQAEESLRITASVFDSSQEAILITDASNNILDVNAAFTRITGYSRDEVVGRNPRLMSSGRQDKSFYTDMWRSLDEQRSWRGEIWNRRKNGEIYAEQLSVTAICNDDGAVQRYVAVFSDISHVKEQEAALSLVAHYDSLTGIPNRVLLFDRMRQAISQTARENNMMAVCYLDLDGFKPINDKHGHEAGDHVLIEISKRIEDAVRGSDTVARIGGDEFVVLLLGIKNGDECVATLERILSSIANPISLMSTSISLSASIGVSLYPLNGKEPDLLLRYSDQAMYIAKQSGKNQFHFS